MAEMVFADSVDEEHSFELPASPLKSIHSRQSISLLRKTVNILGYSGSQNPEMAEDMSYGESKFAQKWERMAKNLLEQVSRKRLLSLSQIPEEVESHFDDIEAEHGLILDKATRRLYYEEFFNTSSGFDLLHRSEVEYVLCSRLGLSLSPDEIRAKLSDFVRSCQESLVVQDGLFTFESYCSLICSILKDSLVSFLFSFCIKFLYNNFSSG